MPVLTERHHTNQAIRFFSSSNKYIGLGRTSAWPNEASPPAPSTSATTIEEAACYAPLTQQAYVVEDEAGTITHLGVKYRVVAGGDVYTYGARKVYVQAMFDYGNAPLPLTFRQVGLCVGLSKIQGAPEGILLPNQVSSIGQLEFLDNRIATVRAIDKVDVVAALISF